MKPPSGRRAWRCAQLVILYTGITGCGTKTGPITGAASQPATPSGDPVALSRGLSLLYPQAEIFRAAPAEKKSGSAGVLLQKTGNPPEAIARYYAETLRKHGFVQTTHLVENHGALLHFERSSGERGTREQVSIDVSRVPYAEEYLLRIGRSEIARAPGGQP